MAKFAGVEGREHALGVVLDYLLLLLELAFLEGQFSDFLLEAGVLGHELVVGGFHDLDVVFLARAGVLGGNAVSDLGEEFLLFGLGVGLEKRIFELRGLSRVNQMFMLLVESQSGLLLFLNRLRLRVQLLCLYSLVLHCLRVQVMARLLSDDIIGEGWSFLHWHRLIGHHLALARHHRVLGIDGLVVVL